MTILFDNIKYSLALKRYQNQTTQGFQPGSPDQISHPKVMSEGALCDSVRVDCLSPILSGLPPCHI
ncbi:hypothetical protein KYS80_10960 [Chromobacterium violaceum]|nr:hypothetical protein [Chromobacterium violaceum]